MNRLPINEITSALIDAADSSHKEQPTPELPPARELSAAEIRAALDTYRAELSRRRPRSGRLLFGL